MYFISQLAFHKKINECGRSIHKTAAQYFSDKSYVRLTYHLCTSKTVFLEDLSSKYKKVWNQMVLSHRI